MGVKRIEDPISSEERAACVNAAIRFGRETIGNGDGYINPKFPVGSLSDFQWKKFAENIISGWIIERSKQLVGERLFKDTHFLATGEIPEPQELGVCATALPALGDFIEKLGLADKAIGEWSKDQILLFIWHAAELIEDARTNRDERPAPIEIGRTLMAG
jgi:hypothetical protein